MAKMKPEKRRGETENFVPMRKKKEDDKGKKRDKSRRRSQRHG